MARRQTIKFIKAITPYKEDDIATFDENLAGRYIKAGHAQHHSYPDDEQQSKKKAE